MTGRKGKQLKWCRRMEVVGKIDKKVVLEVLKALQNHKDRTLRQIGNELRGKGIPFLELYDFLKEMNDLGLIKHDVKMVRLDLYALTEKGQKLLL